MTLQSWWLGLFQKKIGITTMIPKKAGAVEPSDFRPITLSPIISPISRLFHRILARRLSVSLDQDPRQKAFIRHRDGLGENVYILKQAIQISKSKCTALKIAFLDASKAFDSVSHLALLFAVERCGAPSEVTRYIKALYEDNITYIRSKGKFSDPIEVCRGVKRGDPLSPILFNCVVKYITGGLDAAYGIDLGGLKVNHLSFADDLVLLATSDEGLRCLVDAAVARMKTCGLNINASKCSTSNIVTNAKKKQWACNPSSFCFADNSPLPPTTITAAYSYLGIDIGITNGILKSKQQKSLWNIWMSS